MGTAIQDLIRTKAGRTAIGKLITQEAESQPLVEPPELAEAKQKLKDLRARGMQLQSRAVAIGQALAEPRENGKQLLAEGE